MGELITSDMRKQAELILTKAKVAMNIHHVFFASLLRSGKVTLVDEGVATACVNAAGDIRIGTQWVLDHTVPEVMFALAHEVNHPALLHFTRQGSSNPRGWNCACDLVINDILVGVGMTLPRGALYERGASKYIVEELYARDYHEGNIGTEVHYRPGEGLDDLDPSANDSAAKSENQAKWRVAVSVAAQATKQAGQQLSPSLHRLVNNIINPITPWYELLERMMTGYIRAETSWRRPNRKHIGAGLYLPSVGTMPSMGTVVIQSDESGSISTTEKEHFSGHISKIIETCQPERVVLLHVDTEVRTPVEELTVDDLPLQFSTYGNGGTDMRAGINWCVKHGVVPDVFVTLTDGRTPWPTEDPGFPLVWLCTTDRVAPIGTTIR